MTDETLKNIIKSFIPANDNPNEKATDSDRNQIFNNKRSKHLAKVTIIPWVLLFIFVIIAGFFWMTSQISIRQAKILKASIASVAICEHKHMNKIHNELKTKYRYKDYSEIPFYKYTIIMHDLNSRKSCEKA